jgi:hypothetical protein
MKNKVLSPLSDRKHGLRKGNRLELFMDSTASSSGCSYGTVGCIPSQTTELSAHLYWAMTHGKQMEKMITNGI